MHLHMENNLNEEVMIIQMVDLEKKIISNWLSN